MLRNRLPWLVGLTIVCGTLMAHAQDDFGERLELLHGDLSGDWLLGNYVYKANAKGPAKLRFERDDGNSYLLVGDLIEWSSSERTLDMQGSARIDGDQLRIDTQRLSYHVDSGRVEFPSAFKIVTSRQGRSSTVEGGAGWGVIVDGQLRSFEVKNAAGDLPMGDGQGSVPSGRRIAE